MRMVTSPELGVRLPSIWTLFRCQSAQDIVRYQLVFERVEGGVERSYDGAIADEFDYRGVR